MLGKSTRTTREVEEHVCCLYSVSNGFINLRKPGGGSFNRVNGPKLRIRPRKYPTAFGLGLHRFRISLRSLSLQRMLLRTLKASVGLKSAWKEEVMPLCWKKKKWVTYTSKSKFIKKTFFFLAVFLTWSFRVPSRIKFEKKMQLRLAEWRENFKKRQF